MPDPTTSPSAAASRDHRDALLGALVLALFGWFALGACGFDNSNPPPPPPPPQSEDTSYDGFTVSESPSGVNFGGIQCDGQGHYAGGGDQGSEDRMRGAMKDATDKAKEEIGDINRRLEQCKGKTRGDSEIDASFGCERTKAGGAGIRLDNQRVKLAQMEKNYAEDVNSVWLPNISRPTRQDYADAEVEHQTYIKHQQSQIAQLKQDLAQTQAEYDALQAKCTQADNAKANDPCSPQNVEAMNRQREALRIQAASHQYRLDKFNNCMDDRKRQASGGQPTGRTTVDPAILQTLPGMFGSGGGMGRRDRPPRSPTPSAPSQPSHSH